MAEVPIVDIRRDDAPQQIDAACRDIGFFCIAGHGVDPALSTALDGAARAFFARPEDEKAQIAMARGGPAWRHFAAAQSAISDTTPRVGSSQC